MLEYFCRELSHFLLDFPKNCNEISKEKILTTHKIFFVSGDIVLEICCVYHPYKLPVTVLNITPELEFPIYLLPDFSLIVTKYVKYWQR